MELYGRRIEKAMVITTVAPTEVPMAVQMEVAAN